MEARNPPSRWNDQAVDGLAGRVEDLENEREALLRLPEAMGRMDERLIALTDRMTERFNRIDDDHAKSAKAFADSRTWGGKLKDTLAVLVPIFVALIGAYAILHGAQP